MPYHYKFSKPIQEGVKDGKPFFVVEISEYSDGLCHRRTKVGVEDVKKVLAPVLDNAYPENKV